MGQAQREVTDPAANGLVGIGISWWLRLFVWATNIDTGNEGGERQCRVMIEEEQKKYCYLIYEYMH